MKIGIHYRRSFAGDTSQTDSDIYTDKNDELSYETNDKTNSGGIWIHTKSESIFYPNISVIKMQIIKD